MNDLIKIEERADGVLVVDSRLIAEDLNVQHKNLLATIRKKIDRLESHSPVAFQTRVVKKPQGGTYQEIYCLLDERQSLKLMTYSRNTEQVLNCKDKLVDSFLAAKKVIKEVIPQQSDRIKQLELELELRKAEAEAAKAQTILIEKRENVVNFCPEPVQQKILGFQVVEKVEYRDRTFVEEDLINDGSTVTKAFLCDRYGFKTRNGAPSYSALNKFLTQIGADNHGHLWDSTMTVRTNKQFKREHLGLLDDAFQKCSRQMFLGE
ncbi:Phage regulatory protein Rha [Xenococcus sp. PCC 7305]|uniref:Rha family transcriptional regulator n=1 Tax=Xenococcus sp. PCC 7305 TaxID=102125 RepID=UPI0002AD0C73|nr:Rha family transcriptional regulator [Xenococcus sp. PCC 7305]ELS01176.1 Phage regulatory protein Rha [Xenococcus sp. PCC 7305]